MKKSLILLLFVLAKFILQYSLISSEYELHRDEYLHLDQGNHLAWGYVSVPPVNSWLAFIVKIVGNSVFWIKFFPALFGALTIVVVWKTVEELKGNLYARILASTGLLFSVLLRLNMLFQPTSLEVLLWTGLYYVLIKYFNSEKVKWLYLGGIIFGTGFLNKYNIAFSVLGLIPALLVTRQRKIFLQKHLYFSGLLAVIIMLPNIIWQYHNHFPVIHHMKAQILFFIGSLPVILSGFYALAFYRPFHKFNVFFWAYVFTIALFLFFKAKDYYAIGLYPVFIAFGSVFLAQLFKNKFGKVVAPVFILIPVLLFIPLFHVAFPNKSPEYIVKNPQEYKKFGLLRWEDGKDHSLPQDFADMQGWKELAQKVDKEYLLLSKSGHTLVLCDNYGQAGAINYYSEKGIQAVSFNADYINWMHLDKKYSNVIRVKEQSESQNELRETSPYFRKSKIADSVTNIFAREKGTVIFSFEGAKINVNKRIQDEINEVKHTY